MVREWKRYGRTGDRQKRCLWQEEMEMECYEEEVQQTINR